MTIIRIIGITLILTACSGDDPADGRDPDAAMLLDTDAARFRAMIDADAAALDRVLADDLVYTHTTGRVDTKPAFIDALVSETLSYDAITTRDTVVRFYGDAAVVTGAADFDVSGGGQQFSFPLRYTSVYEWSDGSWRLVSWQSTRMSE